MVEPVAGKWKYTIDAQETACYKCLLRIKGYGCDGMHAGFQILADEVRILGGPPRYRCVSCLPSKQDKRKGCKCWFESSHIYHIKMFSNSA